MNHAFPFERRGPEDYKYEKFFKHYSRNWMYFKARVIWFPSVLILFQTLKKTVTLSYNKNMKTTPENK